MCGASDVGLSVGRRPTDFCLLGRLLHEVGAAPIVKLVDFAAWCIGRKRDVLYGNNSRHSS